MKVCVTVEAKVGDPADGNGKLLACVPGGLSQEERATAFVALGVALLSHGLNGYGLMTLLGEAMRAWAEEMRQAEMRARRN